MGTPATGEQQGGGDVPLSEHEQRLLEQMERALYAEDPKFATSLRQPSARRGSRKRIVLGALLALLGLALLITGVAVKLPVVGIVGFVAMLAGAVVAFTGSARPSAEPAATAQPTASTDAHGKDGIMGRLEDRWRQRQEGDES